MRYLSAEYADGLLFPTTPRDRAVVDQWTDWTATRFQPAWIGVFWSVFRTKPERRVAGEIAKFRDEAARCFAILDQRLTRLPYLGGETLTYADIVAGIALFRWTTMGERSPATRGCRGLARSGSGSGRPSGRPSRSTFPSSRSTF